MVMSANWTCDVDPNELRIVHVLRHYHKAWSPNGGLMLEEIAVLVQLPPLHVEHLLTKLILLKVLTSRRCDGTPNRRFYVAREAHLT
jgi:hypothetical protein